jgi:hypothetical protein
MPDLTEELSVLYDELRQDRIRRLEAQLRRAERAAGELDVIWEEVTLVGGVDPATGKTGPIIERVPIYLNSTPGDPIHPMPMRRESITSKDKDTERYDELAHRLRSIVSLTATAQERARAPISTLHESLMLDRIEALCGVSINHDERVDLLIRLRGPRHQLNKRECVEILERFELERWDGMMCDFRQHLTESYTEATPAPLLIVQTHTQRALMPLRVFARAVDWSWWARRLPVLVCTGPLTLLTLFVVMALSRVNTSLFGVGVVCVVLGLIFGIIEVILDWDWRNLYRKPARAYHERALQIALEDTKRAAQAGDLSIKE